MARPECVPEGSAPSGRWRGLVEASSFAAGANWDNCHEGRCEKSTGACTSGRVRAWFGGDTLDPPECSPDNGWKGTPPPGGVTFCRPGVDEGKTAEVYIG